MIQQPTAMPESEERPSKIRKLETAVRDDRLHALEHPTLVGLDKEAHGESIFSPVMENKSADKDDQSMDKIDAVHSPNVDGLQNQDQNQNQSQPTSKNQLKKIRRQQEWEAGRQYRKARRKEKVKEKKARKAEERVTANINTNGEAISLSDPPRRNRTRSIQVPVTFVLDCDFDDLMTEPEMISLGSQLTRSYSENKGSPYRAHMVISSFGGKLKQRFETVLASNHLAWKGVKFTNEDFLVAAHEADAIMRGSQGGRLVGALAELADTLRPTSQPPSGVSSNVEAPITTEAPETTENALPETDEKDHSGNLRQASQEPAINSTGTHSDSHEKPAAGEASFDNRDPSAKSSAMAPQDTPTDVKPPSPSLVPAPAPTPTPSIIYLTSNSPNTLTHLSPYTSYIIGGLVDKNRHKGLCYKRAMALDIPTAKLPIGEYMTMQSRTVLATNHVVEIMVRWLEEGDWGKAFLKVIPKRKEAKLKVKGNEREGDEDGKEEEEVGDEDEDEDEDGDRREG
jgi:tRNA (guanine9-N1)-methyltransferase